VPVMPAEVLELLCLAPGKVAVDATLGGAGHAELMLAALSPGGRLVGIDIDPEAVEWARRRLEGRGAALNVTLDLVHANFADLGQVLDGLGIGRIDALMADLGVSYHQLSSTERGFSFLADAPLDMRMDATAATTASDLVNRLPEKELADIIYGYGQERHSRRIARRIVAERRKGQIRTTAELARVVAAAVLGRRPAGRLRIHPATRTFQALRIAVNDELRNLELLLAQLPERLAPGGRVVIISFHSLEDRRVKEFLRHQSQRAETRLPTFRILTSKPLRPGVEEVAANPRSRSARLRAAERL
jgi:16S rRNA (cytosine1402-N4)-methyltransferase